MTFYWYTPLLVSLLVVCVLILAGCAAVLPTEYRRGDARGMAESILLIIMLLGGIQSIIAVLFGIGLG